MDLMIETRLGRFEIDLHRSYQYMGIVGVFELYNGADGERHFDWHWGKPKKMPVDLDDDAAS